MTRREFIGVGTGVAIGSVVAQPIRGSLGGRLHFSDGQDKPFDSQVEYLESTGTQWLDTGVYVTSDCLFDFEVAKTRSKYNCIFFGTRNSGDSASNNLQCYLNANDTSQMVDFAKITLFTTSTLSSSNWTSGVFPKINQMYEFVGAYCVPTMQQATQTMPLFAFKNINTFNTANCACRIGRWRMYTRYEVISDLYPVRFTNQNGEAEGAMYDAVTGRLLCNLGTGAFVIGRDVEGA